MEISISFLARLFILAGLSVATFKADRAANDYLMFAVDFAFFVYLVLVLHKVK